MFDGELPRMGPYPPLYSIQNYKMFFFFNNLRLFCSLCVWETWLHARPGLYYISNSFSHFSCHSFFFLFFFLKLKILSNKICKRDMQPTNHLFFYFNYKKAQNIYTHKKKQICKTKQIFVDSHSHSHFLQIHHCYCCYYYHCYC